MTGLITSCWRHWVYEHGCTGNFHDRFHHIFPLGVLLLHLSRERKIQRLPCVWMGNFLLDFILLYN